MDGFSYPVSPPKLPPSSPYPPPTPSTPAADDDRGASPGSTLSAPELQSLERMFSVYDADGSGQMSISELSSLLQDLGSSDMTSRGDLDRIFSLVDADGSGTVSFEEFARFWTSTSANISEDGTGPPLPRRKLTMIHPGGACPSIAARLPQLRPNPPLSSLPVGTAAARSLLGPPHLFLHAGVHPAHIRRRPDRLQRHSQPGNRDPRPLHLPDGRAAGRRRHGHHHGRGALPPLRAADARGPRPP